VYAETLAIFETTEWPGEPLTAPDVAESLDCQRRTAYERLRTLEERGELLTKKVGSRGRVWWRPDRSGGIDTEETTDSTADETDGASSAAEPTDPTAASEETFRAAFRGAFDAMLIADDDAAYVDANPAACELFGLPKAELLGQTGRDFAPPEYDFDEAWREFRASDAERGLFPLVRGDGERRIVEFAATPDVTPGKHLSILRDVTERERRERELREQRDELRRIDRLNSVIRGVDREIASGETRRDVETAVCRRLVDAGGYACTGFGSVSPTGTFERRAIAGENCDEVARLVDDGELGEDWGLVAAVESGTVAVTRRPAAGSGDEGRSHGESHPPESSGSRSVAVVPVVHSDTVHGVFAVVSDRGDGFDATEREVLGELGRTMGHAVTALERERALVDEELIEVTVRSDALLPLFSAVGDEVERVTLEQTIPVDDAVVDYFTVHGRDPGATADACDRLAARDGVRVLDRAGTEAWIEHRTSGPSVTRWVATVGGRLRSLRLDGSGTRLVVDVSTGRNVRELVSALREECPDVEFERKRRVHRRDESRRALSSAFGDELTARQRTALALAFWSGYFEWPRETTAEEVAARLGVHPSTLHYHLRRAEATLLSAFFDGRGALDAGIASN
jgi:PAS domain S-box-containing protein